MTIDISPEALAQVRENAAYGDPWDDDFVLALIDALEEARGDAMHAVQALEGENAELRAQLKEARAVLRELCDSQTTMKIAAVSFRNTIAALTQERDEAREEARTYKHALDEARSDYERLKHQVYASAAINGPPTTPEDKFKSLTLSSEITGEVKTHESFTRDHGFLRTDGTRTP